ncbi:unnamed protein product [Cunninghamella blakesleeana]
MANTTQKRVLPPWILRLLGFSSIATLLVSIGLFLYKKKASTRSLPEQNNESNGRTSTSQSTRGNGWSLLNNKGGNKKKKKVTISLKNTVLWNPSSDVSSPNHAFHEHGHELLLELMKQHDVYIIIHVNDEEQKEQMENLLENAGLEPMMDPRKVLFCSTEEGKIHLVRHLEPHIHIEGGWEYDDGEDIIRKLRPFIPKLIWVITKRRRSSFNQKQNLKPDDQGILGSNVELTDHLLDTSFAKELGFVLN